MQKKTIQINNESIHFAHDCIYAVITPEGVTSHKTEKAAILKALSLPEYTIIDRLGRELKIDNDMYLR